MVVTLHNILIAVHIVAGSLGIVAFWVPVIGRKGGPAHRLWGKLFAWALIVTGFAAIGISVTTLIEPMATHMGFGLERPVIIGIFGWMMLYLSVLTINLAWYGLECIRHRRAHAGHRSPLNIALQGILLIASVNCVLQGLAIAQPLMLGISTIGFATVATNLWFMAKRNPPRDNWLREHLKGLVGAGISVYTAFFAFGAVRLMPELALSPVLWAIPLVVGLSIILYHWRAISRRNRALLARASAPTEAPA